MENNIEISFNVFDDIKHVDDDGREFWYARELMPVLDYDLWRSFDRVINNAKISCQNNKFDVSDHFAEVGKLVSIGSKSTRKIKDYKLSRYACYLIVENSDPRKKIIALVKVILLFKQENKKS